MPDNSHLRTTIRILYTPLRELGKITDWYR